MAIAQDNLSAWQGQVDAADSAIAAINADIIRAADGNGVEGLQAERARLTEIMNNNYNAIANAPAANRAAKERTYGAQNVDLQAQIAAIDGQIAQAQDKAARKDQATAALQVKRAELEAGRAALMAERPQGEIEKAAGVAIAETVAGATGVTAETALLGASVLFAVLIELALYGVGAILGKEIRTLSAEIAGYAAMVRQHGKDAADTCGYYLEYVQDDGTAIYDKSEPVAIVEDLPEIAEPVEAAPIEATDFNGAMDAMPDSLSYPVGVDADGAVHYQSIAEMPHMLIAGSTGSGKTQFVKSMLTALCYKARPDELEITLIDPKRVDFVAFRGAALLRDGVVITDNATAIDAIAEAVEDMDERYKVMESKGIDSMPAGYKRRLIVVDEFADLLDVAESQGKDERKELMTNLIRLGQLARAAGIHIVLSTQRPDAKVVEGRLKANMPSTACFRVRNKVNSQIILDRDGADLLNGKGDMYHVSADGTERRLQGYWVQKDVLAGIPKGAPKQPAVVATQSQWVKLPEERRIGFCYDRPGQTKADQTGADRSRPEQTRPDRADQTRPEQTEEEEPRKPLVLAKQTETDQQTRPDRADQNTAELGQKGIFPPADQTRPKLSISTMSEAQIMETLTQIEARHGRLNRVLVKQYISGDSALIGAALSRYRQEATA